MVGLVDLGHRLASLSLMLPIGLLYPIPPGLLHLTACLAIVMKIPCLETLSIALAMWGSRFAT